MEIRVLEVSIEREQKRLGTVKGQGINTFISTNSRDMSARRNIQNYRNRIEILKRENGL